MKHIHIFLTSNLFIIVVMELKVNWFSLQSFETLVLLVKKCMQLQTFLAHLIKKFQSLWFIFSLLNIQNIYRVDFVVH